VLKKEPGKPADVSVSLITITLNCRDVIGHCLDSVVKQEGETCEHIVVDGVSTDGTLDIVRRFGHLSEVISEPDDGIYDALNKGVRHVTGDVVGFLHSDDLMAHGDVLTQIKEAFKDPEVDAVYGDLVYVDALNTDRVIRLWRAGEFHPRCLRRGWMPPHPTLYVRRPWFERLGGFDTRYRIAGDYDFILRLFSQPDFKAVYLPGVMVKMRLGGSSNESLRQIILKTREDYAALRRSGVGGFMSLFSKNFRKVHQFFVR
jgi:glycosyltransferase involved in cell wall biosynthesis